MFRTSFEESEPLAMRHPAYNLKVNKEADRAVMIETIRRAMPLFGNEREYCYIGFGGPFLEDMKRVHAAFPEMKLQSIEENKETFRRQKYHRFINNHYLELAHCKAHRYFREIYAPSGKEIIWLDYLNFGKEELSDFVYLATQVSSGSMLRITVRGEWKDKLPGVANENEWQKIYERFRNDFGVLVPEKLIPDDFIEGSRYCGILADIVISAVRDELSPPLTRFFQPLVSNYYKDDTRMFSMMGVVMDIPPNEQLVQAGESVCDSRVFEAFKDWDLESLDGKKVHLLDVPSLSVKERMALDQHLPLLGNPNRVAACVDELPYLVGRNPGDHERLIRRYATLAQYYAQFARVAS